MSIVPAVGARLFTTAVVVRVTSCWQQSLKATTTVARRFHVLGMLFAVGINGRKIKTRNDALHNAKKKAHNTRSQAVTPPSVLSVQQRLNCEYSIRVSVAPPALELRKRRANTEKVSTSACTTYRCQVSYQAWQLCHNHRSKMQILAGKV